MAASRAWRPVHTRVRVRAERGRRGRQDDREVDLFVDDAAPPLHWLPSQEWTRGHLVMERGHVLADVEHLLLENYVDLGMGGEVWVTSELVLEGHVLGSLGERLQHHTAPGLLGSALRATGRLLDVAVKQAHEVADIYQDPKLRREFAHAVRHPHLLTGRMQRSLLYLVLLSSVWLWVVGLTVLALAVPSWAVAWNLLCWLYFAALGTNLFLPIPIEPLALASAGTVGVTGAAMASAAGKAVGAWIIFSLGPLLRQGMARLERRSAMTRRVMARAERVAHRFGYVALGAMLAVPFSPFDIIPVYLFSTLGLRLGPFLAAVFVGFGFRVFAVLTLGDALFGLGRP